MPLTAVTLTGTFKDPEGNNASGVVRFTLAAPIIDSTGNVIVGTHEVSADVTAGALSVVLYATEGGGVEPANNAYIVEELLDGCARRVYEIAVPDSPTTADLSDYAPVSARPSYEFQGTPGADGADGASAYEVAVANGFVGTEAAWLASLVGPQGDQGDPGSVQTVNGDAGPDVVLTAAEVGADASGSAAAAQAAAIQRANHTGTQAIATVTGLQAALDAKQETSEKGAANGYASLDSGGKVPQAQLPAVAITSVSVVASEAAMLALTAEEGDVAVRTDLTKTFILTASPATVLANWQEVLSPTGDIVSVNGQTGTVVLDAADIPIADAAGDFTATDVEGALAELQADAEADATALADHLADTADAHDASAISYAGGTGLSATDVEGALDELATEKVDKVLAINAQTGTTYTVVLSDEQALVTLSNAAAITCTLPQDSDVAIPVGGQVHFAQIGAGQVTFAAGTGATVNASPGSKCRAQYSAVTAIKRAANTWLLVGDLSA